MREVDAAGPGTDLPVLEEPLCGESSILRPAVRGQDGADSEGGKVQLELLDEGGGAVPTGWVDAQPVAVPVHDNEVVLAFVAKVVGCNHLKRVGSS